MNSKSIGLSIASCAASLALLLVPGMASADIAVTGVSADSATPGEQVDIRIGCGFCDDGETFPISLVPVARAPKPYRCGPNMLCLPSTAKPPRQHPFAFLGRTDPMRTPGNSQHPIREARLRFAVPAVEPGLYAFVIFCGECLRGPRGSLIAETRDPDELLRVRMPPAAHIAA